MDQSIRLETLSAILGATITHRATQAEECLRNRLPLNEFHLSTIVGREEKGEEGFFVDLEDYFDPIYDYDFTNLDDESACQRGDEPYQRPKGWYRMALKVKGKYCDGNQWLGPDGWRSESAPGEWPVSYHGTTLNGAKGIIQVGYRVGNGEEHGQVHGRGIYSTPSLAIAEIYAIRFWSPSKGKFHKVVMQNRINPEKRKKCTDVKDYWLIPVDEGTSFFTEREIVNQSIRPYGILIKEDINDASGKAIVHEVVKAVVAANNCRIS